MNTTSSGLEYSRGAMGKLPGLTDFVRVGAGGREVEAFDRWIRDGLYFSRRALGLAWESAYDGLLYHRFVFRHTGHAQALAGVIRAAMDPYERRYPFVVFARLSSDDIKQHPLWIPTLNDTFFEPMEDLIDELAQYSRPNEILERATGTGAVPAVSSATRARYKAFLDEVSCQEIEQGGGISVANGIRDCARALGSIPRGNPSSIRAAIFPLGQPRYARGLELRFWVELCLILLQNSSIPLSLFWPSSRAAHVQPLLCVAIREPQGAIMEQLLGAPGGTRGIWRMGRPSHGLESRSTGLAWNFGPEMSLKVLLCMLCSGYPYSCEWNRMLEGQ